ncbi:hypothetical protein AAMO2058_001127900 [Amorphochlora amoebiformis]
MNTLVRRRAHLPPAKKTWGYVVVLAIACLIVYQFQPPPGPAMLSKSVQVSHEQTKISSKGWWGSRQSGPAKPEVVPKKKMQSAGFAIDSIISGAALVLTIITIIVARQAESKVEDAIMRGDQPPSCSTWTAWGALIMMFLLWYFFNIYFNIYNKLVLKAYSIPLSLTLMQFAVGVGIVGATWATGAHPLYRCNKHELASIAPLAFLHVLGNLFTNLSLNAVAVSFTHTIKASEPLFAAFLSWLFLTPPSFLMVGSLVPVIGGVALASFTEATFNWTGFGTAMLSNLSFQTRNVVSKKLMSTSRPEDDGPILDNINLFSYITLMSMVIMTPLALFVEGFPFLPAWSMEHGNKIPFGEFLAKSLYAGFFFHTYQQVSYLILDRVHPVTHAVGNCCKRIAVIVVSIVVFRNPVGWLNATGIGISMLGVLMYSVAKRMQKGGAKERIPIGQPGGHLSRSIGSINALLNVDGEIFRPMTPAKNYGVITTPGSHMRKKSRGRSADLQYHFRMG